MLPAQFLLDLGVYMQTAAHIELAIWQTTMHAEGIDLHSAEEHRNYIEIKFKTGLLVKRYRECASRCPPEIAARIRAVVDHVEEGLETRNLAAHGVFFWEDEAIGKIGAAHYYARGKIKDGTRQVFEIIEPITRELAEETLRIADQQLHEVIAIRTAVIAWRYPDGMPGDE